MITGPCESILERSQLREDRKDSVLRDLWRIQQQAERERLALGQLAFPFPSCIPSRPPAHGMVLPILKADLPLSLSSGNNLKDTPTGVTWVILSLIMLARKFSCDSETKEVGRDYLCVQAAVVHGDSSCGQTMGHGDYPCVQTMVHGDSPRVQTTAHGNSLSVQTTVHGESPYMQAAVVHGDSSCVHTTVHGVPHMFRLLQYMEILHVCRLLW